MVLCRDHRIVLCTEVRCIVPFKGGFIVASELCNSIVIFTNNFEVSYNMKYQCHLLPHNSHYTQFLLKGVLTVCLIASKQISGGFK